MKKIFFILAIAASLQVANAQGGRGGAPMGQMGGAKNNNAAVLANYEKAKAAVENPKQNTKYATWYKYGQVLMEAYNASKGSIWVGMSERDIQVLAVNERPRATEQVEINGRQYKKIVYSARTLYFSDNGQLAMYEISNQIVPNALDEAVKAFEKAGELDAKGVKTKDIATSIAQVAEEFNNDAFNSYSFGKYEEASISFEKAASAAATAPNSKTDVNAIYNAGYAAYLAKDYDRAKTFFDKSIAEGYAGEDGDAYAHLAEIATQKGDLDASKNYLEQGFSKNPQSQSILVGLINYYISSGENTDRLFQLLDEARRNEPNNASLYYVEGNIHEKLGDEAKAIAAYNKCADVNPAYEFGYIGVGTHYYNKALALQDKAASELDQDKYSALIGEFEQALSDCLVPFEKAFEISKDDQIKAGIAEYLKAAFFRLRSKSAEYQAKYEKYSTFGQ